MLPMIVFAAVVCGLVLRRMTGEERVQLFHKSIALTRQGATTVRHVVTQRPAGCDEFYAALGARTRWPLVTPAVVFGFLAVHLSMRWNSAGGLDDPLLVEWGASVGPLTTNAEWSRLITAMFIHRGWLHLLADTVGLLRAGALIERVVGRSAFALVFAASGMLAGLWQVAAQPVSLGTGAAGAVFGVYGLLAATMVWGFAQRSPVTIPLSALKRVWPGAAVFVIYHLSTEGFASESLQAGALVGLLGGLILAARVSVAKPPLGRVCAAAVASLAILITFAVPLRGIADVPAELSRVIDVEERTSARYEAESERFKKGRMSADQLAAVADAIGSEVRQVRAALAGLRNVPVQHVPLVRAAAQYLRLREESWRLRVDALRQGRMQTLHKASVKEFEAMRAFETVIASRESS